MIKRSVSYHKLLQLIIQVHYHKNCFLKYDVADDTIYLIKFSFH